MRMAIYGHRIKGHCFSQKSLLTCSSESERGDDDYNDETRNTCQGKYGA